MESFGLFVLENIFEDFINAITEALEEWNKNETKQKRDWHTKIIMLK